MTEHHVIRDQGYGRSYSRVCDTRAQAEAEMAKWQREGLEGAHPSLINGGDWRIEERDA
jgi:predicted metallo-beta-lactamase superfamily hydrolase